MQNDSTVVSPQQPVKIPHRCFTVKYFNGDETDLNFTLVIKCDDAELHAHNDFWSDSQEKLDENEGDIVQTMIRRIALEVMSLCRKGHNWVSETKPQYGINSLFHNQEGWNAKAFEILTVHYDEYIDEFDFIIKPMDIGEVSND